MTARTPNQILVDFRRRHGARILAAAAAAARSATIGRDVKFLRQAALLLPSAFLLDVLVFLLTHGREDPGFGAYPFFQAWAGEAPAAPEIRFLEQALVFFVPRTSWCCSSSSGSHWRSGRSSESAEAAPSRYGRAFGAAFPVLFFVASVVAMLAAERAALEQAPGLADRAPARGVGALRRRGRRASIPAAARGRRSRFCGRRAPA